MTTDVIPDVTGRDLVPAPDSRVLVVEEPKPGKGDPTFLSLLDEIRELHLVMSGGYGADAEPFATFTAVAAVSGTARYEYPILRMIEKLTRAQSLIAQGGIDELGEEFGDIAGLALCAEAMRRQKRLGLRTLVRFGSPGLRQEVDRQSVIAANDDRPGRLGAW